MQPNARLERVATATYRTAAEVVDRDLSTTMTITQDDVACVPGHRGRRMRGSVRMAAGRIYTSDEMRERRAHSRLR